MSSEEWLRYFPEFKVNPPPAEGLSEMLDSQIGVNGDVDYLEFIRRHDGGEGFVSGEVFLRILPLASSWKRTTAIADLGRGLLCFASDGGDTVFAFDRSRPGWPVLALSLTSASPEDVRQVATCFRDFIEQLSSGQASWMET